MMKSKIIRHIRGNKRDYNSEYYYTLYFALIKRNINIPKFIGDIYFYK